MIKKNTQRLLVSLYSPSEPLLAPKAYIELVVPTLSAGGRRSLLHQLQRQQLVTQVQVGQQSLWSLTNQGHSIVEQLFPAFSAKDDQWSVLTFLQPPKTDPGFRYLRRFLLDRGWMSLNRGLYLWQGRVADDIRRECLVSYSSAVVIFEVKSWVHGDAMSALFKQNNIGELMKNYSGISSELTLVINRAINLETMTDQQKKHLCSLFDRLFENIRVDYGFVGPWLSNVSRPLFILRSFQALIPPL